MKHILEHFENEALSLPDPSGIDLKGLNILLSRPNHIMGLHLGDGEFLVLQRRHYYSFRIQIRNLEDMFRRRLFIYHYKNPCDIDYLRAYFDENKDNPFAIENVFRRLRLDEPLSPLTQFPPLFPEKNANSHARLVETLREKAAPADILFSFSRTSGISQRIRTYDRSQWSHCCTVTNDKSLVDVTTNGVISSTFADYSDPNYDLGLYRMRELTPEGRRIVADAAEAYVGVKGFGYYSIFRLYLRKRWRIPYHVVSVSDIIYSNKLELIGYC